MNQTIGWMQSNWYELGSLIAQFALLFAGLRVAQEILKAMRASQQQFGALLRLSMSAGLEERSKESAAIPDSTPSVAASATASPVIDPPTAPTHSSTSYAAFEKPPRSEAPALRDELNARAEANAPMTPPRAPEAEPAYEPTPYVAAPLTVPADEECGSRIAAGRASNSRGGSPWRKVVRWLQAPVRS